VDLQVVSLQSGLVPQFSILNPAQVAILTETNAGATSIATGSVELTEPGQYSILVNSLNNVPGLIVVTLGGEIPAPPPPPSVSVGNPASGALNPGEQASFDIVANPTSATIVDLGDVTATAGLTIELYNPAGNLVGVMSGGLIGGTLIIPPSEGTYQIVLRNDTSAPIPYNISVSAQSTDESTQAEEEIVPETGGGTQPELPADGACVLATRDNAGVNVRENPSLNSEIIAELDPSLTYPVTAQNFDGSWLRVVYDGTNEGWVSWFVTRQGGNCGAVTVIGGDTTQPVAPPPPASTEEAPSADQTEEAPQQQPQQTEEVQQPGQQQQPTATYTPSYTPQAQQQQPQETEEATPPPQQDQQQQQPTATATFTPSYTPPAQQQQPTVTYTPSYTPTTPPAAQVAPEDARFNNPLNIALDSTASVLDFVSYPGGDREDRVRWDITGMNNNSSLPGGRARLVIGVSCFGQNTNQVQFFTGGQTYTCGSTIVDQEVTAASKTGSVVITAVGGEGTYVQWVLTGTATRIN
jgi:hypothetical protein